MNRILLFLIGCIGARTLLTLASSNQKLLPWIGSLTLIISFGFFYIYLFGSETADRQLEWLGEKKIWWNQMRLVHGTLYLIFTILAFNSYPYAWTLLGADTLIGLIVWLLHTVYKINFN